jgi:hypothetical protein
MSRVCEPPRAVYAAAVEALSGCVLRALSGADGAFRLTEQLPVGEPTAGLAAVRVLGADVLAPYVIGGHRFGVEDAEVIDSSMSLFPLSDGGCAGPVGHDLLPVRRLRDWATTAVLARLRDKPMPACPVVSDAADVASDAGWLAWSAALAQLAPLVSAGLDSPVHTRARERVVDTARGVTRSILRRDHLTAARLTRWLASAPDVPALSLDAALTHLALFSSDDPRLGLEIALARAVR